MTAHHRIPTEQISPTELEDGDVVLDGPTFLRVIGEPQSMHSGLGLFDDFQMMIRAEVEDTEAGHRSTRVWGLGAVVVRQQRSKADEDDS
jgi:hypothetical protein